MNHLLDPVIGDCDGLICHLAVIVSRGDVHSDAIDEGGVDVAVVDVVSIDLYLSAPTHEVGHLETGQTYKPRLSLIQIYQGCLVIVVLKKEALFTLSQTLNLLCKVVHKYSHHHTL